MNSIFIDLQKYRLSVHNEHGFVQKKWSVGIGMEEAPTPTGRYRIHCMEDDPYNTYQAFDGNESDVYGTRCIELNIRIYDYKNELWRPICIHGTNCPRGVGKAVSLGCIRMVNGDIEVLYDIVDVGCEVVII